jgi:hypothetical protein
VTLPLEFWFPHDEQGIAINFRRAVQGNTCCRRFALIEAPQCVMTAIAVDTGGIALNCVLRYSFPFVKTKAP